MHEMDLPQEIVVWRIIPAIRKEFVFGLKQKGLSQKKIATYMNITPAAVSQYVNKKRAQTNIIFNEKSRQEIARAIEHIAATEDPKIALQELSRVTEFCRRQRILCSNCDIRKSNCDICFG